MTDLGGRPIVDVRQYATEWNSSFQYTLLEPEGPTEGERVAPARAPAIFDLLGVPHPGRGVVRELRISETMRMGRVHDLSIAFEDSLTAALGAPACSLLAQP